jgi:hypothetical protein
MALSARKISSRVLFNGRPDGYRTLEARRIAQTLCVAEPRRLHYRPAGAAAATVCACSRRGWSLEKFAENLTRGDSNPWFFLAFNKLM